MKMKKLSILIFLLLQLAASASAQSIRDQYATKSEACINADYMDCDEYYTYGQIGWEQASGWRPIQYLSRYESEHRQYNVNMTLYVQIVDNGKVLDDCEIVAFDPQGNVVGNQCPEPFPDGYGITHKCTNVASMAVFGATGDKITFRVVTGAKAGELTETDVEETIAFSQNTILGLLDSDSDGILDTMQPLVLHLASPQGDVNADGTVDVRDAVLLIDHICTGSAIDEKVADANGNGTIETDDVEAIINKYLGK